MKAYAIALIACGSVVAALVLILCCFCNSGRKRKSLPSVTVSTRNVTGGSPAPPPLQVNRDIEKGEITTKSTATRDGGMVILGAAAATVATTAVITSAYSGGGGGGDGGATSGGCGGGGGGCGGGGCGGCGGCGG